MKLIYAIAFAVIYLREVILSTARLAVLVLKPSIKLNPQFVEVPLDLRGEFPQFLYACLISMTPGSLSVSLDRTNHVLIVHLLDVHDPAAEISTLKSKFEAPLIRIFEPAPRRTTAP